VVRRYLEKTLFLHIPSPRIFWNERKLG